MNWHKAFRYPIAGSIIGFLIFLVLPFPFQGGWRWLGGYIILKPLLPYSNWMQHETDITNAFYNSSANVFAHIFISFLLGLGVYALIRKLQVK